MTTELISALYKEYVGTEPEKVDELPSSGSNRRYFRLLGAKRLIGVAGTSQPENEAFLYMARHFREKGLPVPDVYAASADRLCYLQEDLGDTLLFDAVSEGRKSGRYSAAERELLRKAIAILPDVQFAGAEGFDFSQCYPQPAFNRRSVLWDLNYFKYCFLKATGADFREDKLEDDFQRMCDILLARPADTFMYRDFQARNVMIQNGDPRLIDFQGGMRGPYLYDVASFVWQARANYSDELRADLVETYRQALGRYRHVEEEDFHGLLRHFVLFRTLQVLGAYGFRGYFEQKSHFLQSIPFALGNLRRLMQDGFPEYPALSGALRSLIDRGEQSGAKSGGPLTVRVFSFAYKNGLPADRSGNGGGFVFDCRALTNPGKFEQYKRLTGLDEPVIHFLEADGGITRFLDHAYALVDTSVSRYVERGFSDLMVSFGCTGGQHRSVYAAQRMAEHIHDKFGVNVELCHRERNINQLFSNSQ